MPFVTLWQALFAVSEIMKGFIGSDDTDALSDVVEKVYNLSQFSIIRVFEKEHQNHHRPWQCKSHLKPPFFFTLDQKSN